MILHNGFRVFLKDSSRNHSLLTPTRLLASCETCYILQCAKMFRSGMHIFGCPWFFLRAVMTRTWNFMMRVCRLHRHCEIIEANSTLAGNHRDVLPCCSESRGISAKLARNPSTAAIPRHFFKSAVLVGRVLFDVCQWI